MRKGTKKRLFACLMAGMLAMEAVLPVGNGLLNLGVEEAHAQTMGDWEYEVLGDGTISISGYKGSGTEVVIPDKIDGKNVTKIGEEVFKDNACLLSIDIPDSITEIGKCAFENCSGLESIKIPDSVTKISLCAFEECISLKSIKIPSSVRLIMGNVFAGCSGLEHIEVAKENTVYDSRENSNAIIETVCNRLLTGCNSTVIPSGVTEIGPHAFMDCSELESIVIPDGVSKIHAYAFLCCSNLNNVEIPDSVTEIWPGAFCDCSSLENIVIPNSMTSILDDVDSFAVFSGCENLTIYSKSDSLAHKYAIDNDIAWKELKEAPKPIVKPVQKPSTVKSLKQKLSYSTSAATLTWGKVAGATGYEVYRATSKNGKYTKVATVSKTSYKNSKLKAGKTYYYKVRAYKTVNKTNVYGDYSSVITAITKTSAPSVTVKAGKKKATVTWKKVTGADGYEVYMSTSKNGTYKKLKTVNKKTTSYTKSKLTKGKKYYFKVRAYRNVSGKKVYSSWSAVKNVKVK